LLVEYGPGVGTFTGEILRRMHPDATLIAIELNDEFVEFLSAHYPDPRLHVFRGSALEVDVFLRELGAGPVTGDGARRPRRQRLGAPREAARQVSELSRAGVDAVVSGIPFSTLGGDLRRQIIDKTSRVLGPGGHFLAYQFSRALLPHLRGSFREIREEFVPLNILPARIYCCTK
jgi:phospholipid N-methyltransferase